MINIRSHWAGPNLWSQFYSVFPSPDAPGPHPWGKLFTIHTAPAQACCTASVRAAYRDPPLHHLLGWAETAFAEPCSRPALTQPLNNRVTSNSIHLCWPGLPGKSTAAAKEQEGKDGASRQEFITPASPSKKTHCVTLSCEHTAASQMCQLGLQRS